MLNKHDILIISESADFHGEINAFLESGWINEFTDSHLETHSTLERVNALDRINEFAKSSRAFMLAIIDAHDDSPLKVVEIIRSLWNVSPETGVIIYAHQSADCASGTIRALGVTDNLLFMEKPMNPSASGQAILAMITKWESTGAIRRYIEDLERTVTRRTNELNETVQKLGMSNSELNLSIQTLRETQQRMIESNKFTALGEMAGGIAHEINTPLCAIQLTSDQLLEMIQSDELDVLEAVQMLDTIGSTTQRISSIITGLRTFSRDGSTDEYRSERLTTIIHDTLALCRGSATGVDLRVDDIPESILLNCRAVQLSQVLLNLINNSRDAIADQQEKWIQLDFRQDETSIELAVTDSGHGIPEAVRHKIFQPFFTTKPVGKGTGLGLSISKGIIESHGGELFIDPSSANTRFVMRLPKKGGS